MEPQPILCFAYDPFDAYWKQIHQTMHLLSLRDDFGPVLFVEPELWLSRLVRHPGRELRDPERRGSWLRGLRGGTRAVGDRLRVCSPVHRVLLSGSSTWLRDLDRRLMLKSLRRIARRVGVQRPIVWVNRAVPAWLLDGLGERRGLVFNWTDDWSAFGTNDALREETRRRTQELIAAADLVTAVSPALVERARPLNPETFLIRNGTDVDRFATARDPETPLAEEMRGLDRPVLGFVGAITPRLDFPALASLARRRQDWTLVLIGPVLGTGGEERELFSLPNVRPLGPRPYQQLPPYMKGMDVALVPYRRDDLSNFADSIKFYDYLAAGLPVVATNTAGADQFGDLVTVVASAEALEAGVDAALRADGPDEVHRRMRAAQPFSWRARVDEVAQLLHRFAGDGDRGGHDGRPAVRAECS